MGAPHTTAGGIARPAPRDGGSRGTEDRHLRVLLEEHVASVTQVTGLALCDVRERHHLDHGGGSCSRSGSSGRLRSVSIAIATPYCRSIRATRTSFGRSSFSAAGPFEPSRWGRVLRALRKLGGRRLNHSTAVPVQDRWCNSAANSSSADKPRSRSSKATPLLLVGLDIRKGARGESNSTPFRAPDPMVPRPTALGAASVRYREP